MRILVWLCDHWHIPLFAVGAVFGLLLRRRALAVGRQLSIELEAIRQGAKARKLTAVYGAERAKVEVINEHADEIEKLTNAQAEAAEALHHDPVALARYLVRVAHSE